ncbi:MAG TPA: serine hydrolase [Gemmatimonadales bacterium]|nr:serine hydrolase [Gemmatimonadales bacterium]
MLPLLLVTLAAPLAAQRSPAPVATLPRDLDRFVEQTMQEFGVPGLALAIVKDGKVVLARGYGVRTLGTTDKVDARTQFGIASNTKVFTAVALGMLVEQGKLAWDKPVIDYLPWFAMYDPYVTRELTIRDLLVHRSGFGLGAGDLLWWPASTYDRKEIARRLRYIKPATSFRSAYAYDNVLYTVAGEVIETITGRTWEDFVQSEILAKVGMTHSSVRHSDAGEGGNVATTHAKVEGTLKTVAPMVSDNTNPAGGINSGADDMAKWLLVMADSGKLADGSSLYSPRTARQLWSIVTPLGTGAAPAWIAPLSRNFNGYGLGLGLHDYRGVKVATHTGGLPGYVSKVTTVPSARLGVAVLTNAESGEAFEAITWRIVDHYLGAKPFDWIGGFKRQRAIADSTVAAQRQAAATSRDATSRPSLPLAKYAGTYRDAWYGDVEIADEGGKLAIRFKHTPGLVGDLEHWQYDTFLARWRDREMRADAYVTFQLGPDGKVDQVKMVPESSEVDFSFDFQDLLLEPVK